MLQIFGSIDNPLTTLNQNSAYGDLESGGLILFISNLVRLIVLVAGLYAFVNILVAGLDYISSEGDPKGAQAAKDKIVNSIIGIAIIAASFSLTAIISKLFFGSYDAILNPVIYGPGPVTN